MLHCQPSPIVVNFGSIKENPNFLGKNGQEAVARQEVLSTHECTFTRVNFANSHTPSGNAAMREVEERHLRKECSPSGIAKI